MHNLSGIYVVKNPPNTIDKHDKFGFSILLPNKSKKYLCETEEECDKWIQIIRLVTGYEDLNSIYEIKESLGEGRYGKVKRCIQIKNQREAAIKIITKKLLTSEQVQQVNTEIEILKISQHPHIIKLYDVFENQDNIYIGIYSKFNFSDGIVSWKRFI